MGKIKLNRVGDVRKGTFFRFGIPFDDGTDGLPRDSEWIVAPRTPTYDQLLAAGTKDANNWMWMSGLGNLEDRAETRDCPADTDHVTRVIYKTFQAEAFGGNRVSSFIATSIGDAFALSDDLNRRMKTLSIRGARIDPIDLIGHVSQKKLMGFWALQFVGKASLRIPHLESALNQCPYCGRGKIFCESCGDWTGSCPFCKAAGLAIREDKHGGNTDKRVPFESNVWNLMEGKTWDGSDLVQAKGIPFASKRFIDWLLRIHAAPFYAEPVYFCVDGMNDQQKKWFDDLQKPFEV